MNAAQILGVDTLPRWPTASRLLVVENDPCVRRFLCLLLSPHYEVAAVASGELAWATVQRSSPALLLTNLQMPDFDGIDLIRRVRARSDLVGLPIVVLAANQERDLLPLALAAGADEFLVKPFGCAELLVCLQTELARQKTGGHHGATH